jgi:magnesium-transporting ATPase (P-type)
MIESFLPEPVKMVLMGIISLVIVLSALQRKMPNVAWLQAFKLQDNRTEEQKRRAQRSASMLGGFEMIFAGVAVPAVYLVGTVMFFNEPTQGALLLVGALSVVLIGLGVRVIVKAARSTDSQRMRRGS